MATTTEIRLRRWSCGLLLAAAAAAPAASAATVALDELTSPELRARIAGGATTVLLPIGATEQSGPHLALGKHNQRAQVLATQIAERLGQAVVAPVLAYVPEGSIEPPAAHMRYSGTISIPESVFEALLVSAAQSLCHHGFRDVVLLGDHGGYQASLERVAAKLERERKRSPWPACRTYALTEYYRVTQTAFVQFLESKGYAKDEIGTHAGLADTALTLATAPALVRQDLLGRALTPAERAGVQGDPRRATLAMGQAGLALIVDTTVQAIRHRVEQAR
ncbi:creatininase family protein [Ideonella sp. YS5]|uniref:creatininase family protein n=1 Tax=Ideonella sp. YS5 TaxID=3453714 RepID=UPI003EEBAC93